MSDIKYDKIDTPEIRLIEECSELIKIVSRAIRFGWDNYHPAPHRPESSNKKEAIKKFQDIIKAWNEIIFIQPSITLEGK